MSLQVKIVLISFMISILSALIVLPILKKLKVGQIERECGPRTHLVKQGTPTMGGIVIAITLVIATLILYSSNKEILPLVLATIGFGVVGFVDDFKKLILKDTEGLKPTYKIVRTTYNINCIRTVPNKTRTRHRNNNTNTKNRTTDASTYIYTIRNICNACCNKCSKPNRRYRRIRCIHFNDNNSLSICHSCQIRHTRNNSIRLCTMWSMLRIFNIQPTSSKNIHGRHRLTPSSEEQ